MTAALVHCDYCNKTHAARPTDTPCAPRAWREDSTGLIWEDARALAPSAPPTYNPANPTEEP